MRTLYGKKGTTYQLGEKIGAGGEGTVFKISSEHGKVAKVFHDGKYNPDVMRRKIETMISMPIKPVVDGSLRMAGRYSVGWRYVCGLCDAFSRSSI